MRTIETEDDVAEGLAHLAEADPRLVPVIAAAGPVPVRRRGGGFEGLVATIVSQQLSAASAAAIWRRVEAGSSMITPDAMLAASDEELRSMGLSGPKIRTIRAAATACIDGLDLDALADMPPDNARHALTAIKGIGPWSADIYLLFCLGHADIFPAGDLALRIAVGAHIGAEATPSEAETATVAEAWSPWRGVAAALFWAYYRTLTPQQKRFEAIAGGGNVKA